LPNSKIDRDFFAGFLCAMTLFSGLGIQKLTYGLFPIFVHSEKGLHLSVSLHQMNE